MVLYHYSSRTGMVEECTARTVEHCEFSAYPHSENFSWVEKYRQDENKARKKAIDSTERLLKKDYLFATFSDRLLWSDTGVKDRSRVTIRAMEVAKVDSDIIQWLKSKSFCLFRRSQSGIASFLNSQNGLKDVAKVMESLFYTNMGSDLGTQTMLDRWQLRKHCSNDGAATNFHKPVLNHHITSIDNYSLANVWLEYVREKKKRGELREFIYGMEVFYAIVLPTGQSRPEESYWTCK
ncbi:TPA: hypothetical protein ACHVCJ_000597 [Streptococcus suis]